MVRVSRLHRAPGPHLSRHYNTFGFEAEFSTGVVPMLAGLSDRGLMPKGTMLHSYHCRCETCDFDSEWTFRAQSDSSCDGEVISTVFEFSDDEDAEHDWSGAVSGLQDAAVEADAEPGLRAGFHVHVGRPGDYDSRPARDAFWSYLRWESVLGELAQGRYPNVRDFNTPARQSLAYWDGYDRREGDYVFSSTPWRDHDVVVFDAVRAEETCHNLTAAKRAAMVYATGFDRHGWLSVATRSGATWEFRLWNSTRSAWRMEMFCRMSLLMVNPHAVEDLLVIDPNVRVLATIADKHDPGLGELVERQLASDKTSAGFTCLLGAPQANDTPPPLRWNPPGRWTLPAGVAPVLATPTHQEVVNSLRRQAHQYVYGQTNSTVEDEAYWAEPTDPGL